MQRNNKHSDPLLPYPSFYHSFYPSSCPSVLLPQEEEVEEMEEVGVSTP